MRLGSTTTRAVCRLAAYLLATSSSLWGTEIVLDNQTQYPDPHQQSKMLVHWATSGKEVQDANYAVRYAGSVNEPHTLVVQTTGVVHLTLPEDAEYFRVLVWEAGEAAPKVLTNWVDVIDKKIYSLRNEHLVPIRLMAGTGC